MHPTTAAVHGSHRALQEASDSSRPQFPLSASGGQAAGPEVSHSSQEESHITSAALSVSGPSGRPTLGATPAGGGRSQEIRAGWRPPPAPGQAPEGAPAAPETRSRCERRCQHSWKVTPGLGGGAVRGIRPSPLPHVLPAQLPPANKVSSWLRPAAHPPATSASLAPTPSCFLGRAGGVPPTPSPGAVGEEPGPTPPLRR